MRSLLDSPNQQSSQKDETKSTANAEDEVNYELSLKETSSVMSFGNRDN